MNHQSRQGAGSDGVLAQDAVDSVESIEEPEGMDVSDDLEMKDYPLDSLLIRSDPRTVFEVCRRIKQNHYVMDPDFQRDFIWSSDKQSRLIESLLMRIPLPVFYLAERDDGKIIVIDGLQRLTTISNFLDNAFALRYLDEGNVAFYGKYFKDLSPKLQSRLEDTQLILYILDEKVPERARLDIFERVNGGTPLSRQQMRNCMYCGPATRMLTKLSKDIAFYEATGRSLSWQSMRDREFINRFMAFHILGVEEYKGNMDQFLADALKQINQFDAQRISLLEEVFLQSMKCCHQVWGRQCFRKHGPGQEHRNVINAALFDVISTKMISFPKNTSESIFDRLRQKLFDLLGNDKFNNSITSSTNSLKQVNRRFRMVDEAFQEVFEL